jgi:hypothetical protein
VTRRVAVKGEPRVPFPFAAIPRASFAALRDAKLTVTEWRVLVTLYERASPPNWTVKLKDLDSLVRLVCWEGERDTISKTLRSLKAKGWIAYESRPGSTHHRYAITLLGPPEHDPSSNACTHVDSNPVPAQTDPSSTPVDPSSQEASTLLAVRDRAAVVAAPIRAPLEPSRRAKRPRRTAENAVGEVPRAVEEQDQPDTLFPINAVRARRGAYDEEYA